MSSNASVESPAGEKMLLRKLMKVRITCSNSASELETLDGLTDDWHADEKLESVALDIHLQCEYCCNESSRLHDILTGFLTDPGSNVPGWLWTEVELRQENAATAAA